jgi:hypothetical protein
MMIKFTIIIIYYQSWDHSTFNLMKIKMFTNFVLAMGYTNICWIPLGVNYEPTMLQNLQVHMY